MGITLITYNAQTVQPKHDAVLQDSIQGSGVFKGCEITYLGSNILHISEGYGIIKGRIFEVTQQDINVPLPTSGSLAGRVYLHMDLGTETPISILVATGATLPDLTEDEDCNYTNGIYELELATFTATASAIASLVNTVREIDSSGSGSSTRQITLPVSGWSSGTTTINGSDYYTQTVEVSKIYSDSPIISIGAAGMLPTESEEEQYAYINAAIADRSAATITFYAKTKPTAQIIVIAKEVK